MKYMQPALVIAVVVALCALMFTGSTSCNGLSKKATRDAAQFPPALLAWPGVEGDYLRGIDDGVSDGDLDAPAADALRERGREMQTALEAKSVDALRLVPWEHTMRAWADRGIADKLGDGEIGPTVALELNERVVNFTATIVSLQRIN